MQWLIALGVSLLGVLLAFLTMGVCLWILKRKARGGYIGSSLEKGEEDQTL